MKFIKFSVLELVLSAAVVLSFMAIIGMVVELAKISEAMGIGHGVGRYMLHEKAICEAASNAPCVIKAIGVPVKATTEEAVSLLDFVDPAPQYTEARG